MGKQIQKAEQKIEKIVKQTISKYKLCNKHEKVLVALSGGADSGVTAYLLKKFGYNVEAIYINLHLGKYSDRCLEAVRKLCKELGIKLHIYDLKKEIGSSMCYIRARVKQKQEFKHLSNCAVCGVFKKYILNKKARDLRAGKLATGHNLDDEIQTFLMNIFKGSVELSANLGPILDVKDKKFIPRIKPLFFVTKKEIKKYSKQKKLPAIYEVCPCRGESYRVQVMGFLNNLSERDKENLFKNAQKLVPKIKIEKTPVLYCEVCGEPARGKICRRCELVGV